MNPFKEYRKTNKNPIDFPDEFIDEKNKKRDYCKTMCEAMHYRYSNDQAAIHYSTRDWFWNLRRYGNGSQSENFYKPYMIYQDPLDQSVPQNYDDENDSNRDKRRKGYINVAWDILSPANKIRSALIGRFQESDYDISVDTIDPYSGAKKEKKKWDLYRYSQNKEVEDTMLQQIGLKPPQHDFLPNNMDELEMYDEIGGFKLVYAKAMEKIVRYSFMASEFDDIKDMMNGDFIDYNMACIAEYFDSQDGVWKIKHVDPANVIMQYSDYPDHRDSEWGGYYTDMTISDLRQYGIEEKDLRNLAKKYCGYKKNPTEWNKYDKKLNPNVPDTTKYGYDFFKVCVLCINWIDTQPLQYNIHTNVYGKEIYTRQKYGAYTPRMDKNAEKKGMGNKKKITNYKTVYRAKWIPDTDIVFDYGKEYNVPRESKNKVRLPIHLYKIPGRSITEQLVPLYNNWQQLWLKYQDAIIQARKHGFVINWQAIANFLVSGEGDDNDIANMKETIKMYIETGIIVAKFTDTEGDFNTANFAIQDIPGGAGQLFQDILLGMRQTAVLFESVTGINPLILGQSPDPRQAVKTSDIAAKGTLDIIRPIFKGYLRLKKSAGKNCLYRVHLMVKSGNAKGYDDILNESEFRVLKEAAENPVRYGLDLIPRPTIQEIIDLKESINLALQSSGAGLPGIRLDDKLELDRLIAENVPIKTIRMILTKRINQREKEARETAMQAQVMNAQMQQQAAAMQQQGAAQQAQIDGAINKDVESHKAGEKRLTDAAKHEHHKDYAITEGEVKKDTDRAKKVSETFMT